MRRVGAGWATTTLLVVLLSACGTTRSAGSPGTAPSSPATTTSQRPTSPPVASTAPGTPAPHVMLIVLENREKSDVIGSSQAPELNSLARHFGLAPQAYATTHPSLPNYLELLAGSTFGISSDCTTCSVDGQTLVDQLDARGIDWRAYMEGQSRPCDPAISTAAGYAKKHDPFAYVRHLVAHPATCNRVVPASELAGDLASTQPPAFIWYTPNLCHDGHDCPTTTMDHWVAGFVPSVMASRWYAQGGAIIITFDEGSSDASCCRVAHGGRIATLVISAHTHPGRRLTSPVDQAGILATIEDLYAVSRLGDAACPCAGSLRPLL